MRQGSRHFILLLTTLSFLGSACAPHRQELRLAHPQQSFPPKVSDTDVKKQGLYNLDFDQSVTVKSTIKPATLYRLAETLMKLGASEKNQDLSESGEKLLEKMRNLPGLATPVRSDRSPYAQLAISETKVEVEQALTQVDQQLNAGEVQLNELLTHLGASYAWPAPTASLAEAGNAIAGFLGEFSAQAQRSNIFDALKAPIQQEIGQQQQWILGLTQRLDQKLQTAKKFPELMQWTQKFLVDEKLTPPPDLQASLQQGNLMAQDISACNSAQAVLTTVVDIWNILDDNGRIQYIKPESDSLYDYLKKSDAGDLKCLRADGCSNPLKFIIKKLFILPKINHLGVAKVCDSIEQSALSYVKTAAQKGIAQIYPQMPELVSTALNKAISEKAQILHDIQNNYPGFIKQKLQAWSETQLLGKGQLHGIDAGQVQVALKQKELRLQAVAGNADAESFAQSMAALAQAFRSAELSADQTRQSSFDLINHLVALGGYRNENGALVPALLSPMERSAPLLDLSHLASQTAVYGLPDQFQLTASMTPQQTHPVATMSARSQAELMRALSQVIYYLSDWRRSAYDKALGSVTAADLVPEYKDVGDLQRSLFPKPELMTLAIGDLAVTLENLTKKMAPVFVVGVHDDKVMWLDDYDLEKGEMVAMAGVVDIVKGERAKIVRSQDVARWILALAEFLHATDGIEKTRSDILREKDAQGASALDSLIKARRQLKLLVVAFANLLSHQMVAEDGLIVSQLALPSLTAAASQSLLDQAMALQALVKAADVTGIEVYRVSALELYYSLNAKKYLAKMHFYSMSGKVEPVDVESLSEMVSAISGLKASLPEKSRDQAEWILQPWLAGLSHLH
jgi:hypothetical protein